MVQLLEWLVKLLEWLLNGEEVGLSFNATIIVENGKAGQVGHKAT